MTLESKGNLQVANYGSNQVPVYNPQLVQVSSISQALSGPNRLALDSLGNLYVSNARDNAITVYDPNRNQITSKTMADRIARLRVWRSMHPGTSLSRTTAATASPLTHRWSSHRNAESRQSPPFRRPRRRGHPRLLHAYRNGPAVCQSLTNSYEMALFLKGHAGEVVTYFGTSDEGPTGIAFDSAGNVYIDYFYTGTAVKYSPTNQVFIDAQYWELGQGEGIAVDQEGDIQVALACSFNTINICEPSGQLINRLH